MDTSTLTKRSERSIGSRLLEKALMPIVATAASAAAGYAVKKAPQLVEAKVVPRVRELTKGATGDAGDVAEHLAERVRSVTGGTARNGRRRTVSSSELDRRMKERAKHRSARQRASS